MKREDETQAEQNRTLITPNKKKKTRRNVEKTRYEKKKSEREREGGGRRKTKRNGEMGKKLIREKRTEKGRILNGNTTQPPKANEDESKRRKSDLEQWSGPQQAWFFA